MRSRAVSVLFALVLLITSFAAGAHEVRPALVQLTQRGPHEFELLWKQPVNGDVALHLVPRLSGGGLDREPDVSVGGAGVRPETVAQPVRRAHRSSGQTLSIVGLDRSITDVLVSVTLLDGRTVQQGAQSAPDFDPARFQRAFARRRPAAT